MHERWEQFLAGKTAQEAAAPAHPGDWTIRDIVLHLIAWQQLSIARLQAALNGEDPRLPGWLEGTDPFYADEHVDEFNARILERYRADSWSSALGAWREGFQRFLELAEAIPEAQMFDATIYPWVKGYALSDAISG